MSILCYLFCVHETKYIGDPDTGHVREVTCKCLKIRFCVRYSNGLDAILNLIFAYWYGSPVPKYKSPVFESSVFRSLLYFEKVMYSEDVNYSPLINGTPQIMHSNHLNTRHPHCPLFR